MAYFQDFKNIVGKEVTSHILKEVSEGKFIVDEANEFAYHLHPYVGGSFVHARGVPNFKFGRGAMQTILSDWFNQDACNLSKEDVIAILVNALENSDKHVLAKNIEKIFLPNGAIGTPVNLKNPPLTVYGHPGNKLCSNEKLPLSLSNGTISR